MNRLSRPAIAAGLAITLLAASTATSSAIEDINGHNVLWGYDGDIGPERWGSLDPAYTLCSAGLQQSPINLDSPGLAHLGALQFDYHPSALTVTNNGHSAQVEYDPGSSMTVDGQRYELVQFHFHHPSEHTLGGEVFPMEMHLVHRDATGSPAVVSILVRSGADDNAALATVFDNVPATESAVATGATVDAGAALPTAFTYYTYSGSLTTPPCTEGIRWFVLSEPITLSVRQIAAFTAVFDNNARPVQPLDGRTITEEIPAP